jgi:glycosyltransferase involved in cell wall biosynthesis
VAPSLVVRPIPGLLPVRDARDPVRVLIASLAPGGAERIVLEWLGAEAARGRETELAVLHRRQVALAVPEGVKARVRGRETPEAFLRALGSEWRHARAPVSTHLITDDALALLWAEGVRTVPVVHNARAGWRNDPRSWKAEQVPQAVACADAVRAELRDCGVALPLATIRHRPAVGRAAFDPEQRRAIRAELRVGEGTFLVGAIGAIKSQKDHARAVEVLASLAARRDAVLVVLGGILERAALGEFERIIETAIRLNVVDRLRLPGFVEEIEPWLAACDALLNVSRYEGLSIAVQEALAAGLPVVAADVGGQAEISHPALELLAPASGVEQFAARLANHPVRARLLPRPFERAPRAWSLTLACRKPCGGKPLDTLFVTANLNAGGAQRSLVNLAATLGARRRFAVAVCGESTHGAFAGTLARAGVEAFRVTDERDDFAIAESLLATAAERGARTLCFWNAAPGVKLLVSRFAPKSLRLIDVSPGRYAFEELESAGALAAAIDHGPAAYYRRLDTLVLKYSDPDPPPARVVVTIPNGVAVRAACAGPAEGPRYLVSGRIAPSKRLETVLDAFAGLREHHSAAELHVVGVAEPRHASYLESLCAGPAPGIVFRGEGFDLGHLDERWTAAIVLGTHQGCPNAVLEAMAAAIPVIANASGGTGELVIDGESGWLLPEDADAPTLAAAMQSAWQQSVAAHARAAHARVRLARTHGLEAMAARYLDILAAEGDAGHERIAPWNSASAPAVPAPSPSVPSLLTASS